MAAAAARYRRPPAATCGPSKLSPGGKIFFPSRPVSASITWSERQVAIPTSPPSATERPRQWTPRCCSTSTRSQAAVGGPARTLSGIGTSGRLARLPCMRHLRLRGLEEVEQDLVREPLRRRLQVGAQQRGVIGRQLEVPSLKAPVDPLRHGEEEPMWEAS